MENLEWGEIFNKWDYTIYNIIVWKLKYKSIKFIIDAWYKTY